jgi:Nif-specific regulatory protein
MTQRQLELQRDLYRLLLGVNDKPQNIDNILTSALGLIVQITSARIGYIELRNSEGTQWWSTYRCSDTEIETIRRRISSGIIAQAISTGETIVTPSAFLDPRFSSRESVREERIEAVLCSPFKRDGIVGVIYLQGDEGAEFDNDHCMMETELFAQNITPLLCCLRYQVEAKRADNDLRTTYDLTDIVGKSQVLMVKLQEAMAIAELDVSVLITGETGSGKGALARVIHKNSSRKYKPFIHLNCANLPEQLTESELFGAARGAHSGAYTEIKGKIAAAKGGTLFFDEIGVLPVTIQAKLLQFLDDGYYYPLGSTVAQESDVRIISASNIDFKEAIKRGSFREDLYYRLCVFPIEMPPLKQRKEDIPALVEYFINKYCQCFKMPEIGVDPHVLFALQECEWDGNVRQLENKVQQGVLRARVEHAPTLLFNHLLPDTQDTTPSIDEPVTYREGKDDWERRFLNLHLEKHAWNISETAKSLDLSRSHLNNLIKFHNLERRDLHDVHA